MYAKSNQMKKGQVVTIYSSPVTEESPEGEAKLIGKITEKGQLEFWSVEFISDGFRAQRWIKKK